jgi:hypothetical protein
MTSKFKLLWTKIKDAFKIDTTPIESRNGGSINLDLCRSVRQAYPIFDKPEFSPATRTAMAAIARSVETEQKISLAEVTGGV